MADTKNKLDDGLEYFLEQAKRTDDPEMKKLYIDGAVKFANVAVEFEKNEKTQEFEERKYEESKDWRDPKFLIAALGQGGIMILLRMYESRILLRQTKMVCEFEKDYTFTTTAGRGLGAALKALPIFK